jgi:hypothetical protein
MADALWSIDLVGLWAMLRARANGASQCPE